MVPPKKGRGIPNSLIKSVFTFCLKVITITMVNIAKISKNIAPVQLVEVVDGEGQAEHVDQNPKQVQHVVAVRTLRNHHHNCEYAWLHHHHDHGDHHNQWSSHLNDGTRWLMNMVVKVCSKSPAQESGTQVDGDTREPGQRQCGQDNKNCQYCYYQESQNDFMDLHGSSWK